MKEQPLDFELLLDVVDYILEGELLAESVTEYI